jgi:uncharacterized protein YllA (UPF0747 family)
VFAVHFFLAGLGTGAEGDQATFLTRQLSLEFLAVVNDAVDSLFRDVRDLNTFARNVCLTSKADISAESSF